MGDGRRLISLTLPANRETRRNDVPARHHGGPCTRLPPATRCHHIAGELSITYAICFMLAQIP
ncbi:hypothetical protein E2C01_009523 [Portunus trituberculatus]|uniref:Uncharacterized protein n=1 Tax=Portunus trituberculatus TaxID=210409 RepID=A0A5B7D617_PORTR|nr:hypothetical protein [Portunus trituberculatus]